MQTSHIDDGEEVPAYNLDDLEGTAAYIDARMRGESAGGFYNSDIEGDE